ncbi:M23 family metallopeptidase [Paenibacillus sinopodophylli]|uniref:M23 family metallopeptidase n=1 Tax=Paenibacillus sinopodophylli TaxID=1837342 RepID=UPI00110CDD86|nr:M23 family metallopeptidase [Paenibacillus sinopodophylli]
MHRRTIIILFIFIILPSTLAYAEDNASVLLKKYNVSSYDPVEEGKKLKLLEEEYSEVSYRVNTHTMLEEAMKLHDEQRKNALMSIDADIYEITDELSRLENLMKQSLDREVPYLMELDARYRTAMQHMIRKQEARKAWVEQQKDVSVLSHADAANDRNKLESLSPKLEKQKKTYEKALACPVLGEVSDFQSPLEIPVQLTSSYGARLDPITMDVMTFHHGMDMHAPEGTAVLAAFHGQVEEAASGDELGNYVVINHGCGVKTLYGHLESYQVSVGEQVLQYQSIARSGNTGTRTTGPHLHFGVYINGKSVDPSVFVAY